MEYQEAKAYISSLTSKKAAELTDKDKAVVEEVHQTIYKVGVPYCNCTNRYTDAVVKLALWFRSHSQYSKCKYVIRAGMAYMLGMNYYNNSNLTDEVAEEILRINPTAAEFIKKVETKEPEAKAPEIAAAVPEKADKPVPTKKRRK